MLRQGFIAKRDAATALTEAAPAADNGGVVTRSTMQPSRASWMAGWPARTQRLRRHRIAGYRVATMQLKKLRTIVQEQIGDIAKPGRCHCVVSSTRRPDLGRYAGKYVALLVPTDLVVASADSPDELFRILAELDTAPVTIMRAPRLDEPVCLGLS